MQLGPELAQTHFLCLSGVQRPVLRVVRNLVLETKGRFYCRNKTLSSRRNVYGLRPVLSVIARSGSTFCITQCCVNGNEPPEQDRRGGQTRIRNLIANESKGIFPGKFSPRQGHKGFPLGRTCRLRAVAKNGMRTAGDHTRKSMARVVAHSSDAQRAG